MSFKTIKKTVVPDPYEETTFVCETCGNIDWVEEDAQQHGLNHVFCRSIPGPGCELIHCPVDDQTLLRAKLEMSGYRPRYTSVAWTGPGWYAARRDEWDSDLYEVMSINALVQQLQKQVESTQKQIVELEAINQGEVK